MAARRCTRACHSLARRLQLSTLSPPCGSTASRSGACGYGYGYGYSTGGIPVRVVIPCRHYASPRAPKVDSSYADVFDMELVPRTCFETVISGSGNSFKRLSPDQYYGCAQRFSEAIRQGSSPWAVSLDDKGAFSAEVVHDVACIMRQVPGRKASNAFAVAMWASAAQLGYRPSTLSLARHLIRSGAFGRLRQLRAVEDRFMQLVSTGKDPDALTAEGELLYEQGSFDAAVATLRRALRIPGPGFEWKPHCELCLGKALLKLGRRAEAKGLFEDLSKAGLAEADAQLGMMLRASDRERAEQLLYAAACRGRRDSFAVLAEMALEGAALAAADGGCGEEGRRWALEWSRLADARAEY